MHPILGFISFYLCYLFSSFPFVPAVLHSQQEREFFLQRGRCLAGCKASVCLELGSASLSGTAAHLCNNNNNNKKRKVTVLKPQYYIDIFPQKVFLCPHFAVDTKSLSSPPPSSKASSVLASPVDCRPITTHCRENRSSHA